MLKVNEYFEGAVKSIAVSNSEGTSTVGVISSGEYEFGTSSIEIMTVITGTLGVKLNGESEWAYYNNGKSFTVAADSKFRVKAEADTAYLCQYK